jgi:hypothetical protein
MYEGGLMRTCVGSITGGMDGLISSQSQYLLTHQFS